MEILGSTGPLRLCKGAAVQVEVFCAPEPTLPMNIENDAGRPGEQQGRLKLDHLISGKLRLDQINEGFAALKSAAPVRQLPPDNLERPILPIGSSDPLMAAMTAHAPKQTPAERLMRQEPARAANQR